MTAGSQGNQVWTTRNVPSQWLWSNVPAGARYGMVLHVEDLNDGLTLQCACMPCTWHGVHHL